MLRRISSLAVVSTALVLVMYVSVVLACKPAAGASCSISTQSLNAWVMIDKMPDHSTSLVTAHLEGDLTGLSVDSVNYSAGDIVVGSSQTSILNKGESMTWNVPFSDHATGFVRVVVDDYTTKLNGKVVSKSHGAQTFSSPVLACTTPVTPPVTPVVPPGVTPPAPPAVVTPPATPVVPAKPNTPAKTPKTHLRARKRLPAHKLAVGGGADYVISVKNLGNVDAKDVDITDLLPSGLTVANGAGLRMINGQPHWLVKRIPAGATVYFGLQAKVSRDAGGTRQCNGLKVTASNAPTVFSIPACYGVPKVKQPKKPGGATG